jgi:hypothetical protein
MEFMHGVNMDKYQLIIIIFSANVHSVKKEQRSKKNSPPPGSVINSVCSHWQMQSTYLRKLNGGSAFVLATGNT